MSEKALTRGEATGLIVAILTGGFGTLACGATVGAIEGWSTPTAESIFPTEGHKFLENAARAVLAENSPELRYLRAGNNEIGQPRINSWYIVLDAGDSTDQAQRLLDIFQGAITNTPDGIVTPEDLRQSRIKFEPGWSSTTDLSFSGVSTDCVRVAINGRFAETDGYGSPTLKELHVIDIDLNPVSFASIESGANKAMFDDAVLAIRP